MNHARRRFLAVTLGLLACTAAFAADKRKKIVMLIAEPEYETARTLPEFARQHLEKDFRVVIVGGSAAAGATAFDSLNELNDADVLLVSVRRRTPPKAQLEAIRRYVSSGRPVIGIRTASHAFALSKNQKLAAGQAEWPEFDHQVIGGNYANHHGKGAATVVTPVSDSATKHSILRGVQLPFSSETTLYRNTPLRDNTTPLLIGAIPNQPSEPVAWIFTRANGGRTFYTSLGGPTDFQNPSFTRMLLNAFQWAVRG